jgi:hypothetical protein
MEGYFNKNNIKIPKGAITEELITSYIPIYKEGKEKSPKKVPPTLSGELYSKWCENTTLNVYDEIHKYTGKQIAQALAEIGINAEELIGTINYSKKKTELTNALIEAYNKKCGRVSSKDETKEIQDEGSDDEVYHSAEEDEEEKEEEDIETRKNELVVQYEGMTVKELKALCKERSIEIDKSAKKPDLVELLVEYELNA